ncbi:hypothetical protein ACRALDRAFT_2023078 [Sodiomyces alcalophilus JCM 7366]|uniref:uncharacterized protein n=1 Tax=Sodiomyces alcalophilus JCM 7366 TaxID=591952 RepID=UPI0039B44D28
MQKPVKIAASYRALDLYLAAPPCRSRIVATINKCIVGIVWSLHRRCERAGVTGCQYRTPVGLSSP